MRLPGPLIPGTLIRRYKRFLADVEIPGLAEPVTAHVANPGSMLGMAEAGARIWLSRSADPKRKLPWSWEALSLPEADGAPRWCGVSTSHPNRIVEEALKGGVIDPLAGFSSLRREVRYGENSRIDFLLEHDGAPPTYVEVKNVSLRRQSGLAEFPDSVTARGAKHLRELQAVAENGDRAVMLYLLQRDDVARLAFAADIDPAYARGVVDAARSGVEFHAYLCRFEATPATEDALASGAPESQARLACYLDVRLDGVCPIEMDGR